MSITFKSIKSHFKQKTCKHSVEDIELILWKNHNLKDVCAIYKCCKCGKILPEIPVNNDAQEWRLIMRTHKVLYNATL